MGGLDVAVPVAFLEGLEELHQLVQVAAMKATVEHGPSEPEPVQSANGLEVELAQFLPPPQAVDPIGKLSVKRIALGYVAMPVLLPERL